jgi:hypothetical protein
MFESPKSGTIFSGGKVSKKKPMFSGEPRVREAAFSPLSPPTDAEVLAAATRAMCRSADRGDDAPPDDRYRIVSASRKGLRESSKNEKSLTQNEIKVKILAHPGRNAVELAGIIGSTPERVREVARRENIVLPRSRRRNQHNRFS